MPPWRLIPLQRILKCKVVKCFRELSTESCYGIPGRYGLCSGLNPCCWGQALTGVLRSDLSWSVGWPAKTKFVRDPKPKHVIIENDIQSSIDLWACSECWQSGLILDRVGPLRHPWLGLSPSCSLSCRCSRWLLGGVDLSLWGRAQVDLWGTNDNLKLSHSMFYFPRSTLFSSSCWSHSCSCPARRWALTASWRCSWPCPRAAGPHASGLPPSSGPCPRSASGPRSESAPTAGGTGQSCSKEARDYSASWSFSLKFKPVVVINIGVGPLRWRELAVSSRICLWCPVNGAWPRRWFRVALTCGQSIIFTRMKLLKVNCQCSFCSVEPQVTAPVFLQRRRNFGISFLQSPLDKLTDNC